MIQAAALMVMTGLALLITVALIVGIAWVAVAIPVSICALVAHGIGAMGYREPTEEPVRSPRPPSPVPGAFTSGYRARRHRPSDRPGATRSRAARTPP
jgi:hypothetical protein